MTQHCEYCEKSFDPGSVPDLSLESGELFECPTCKRWTEKEATSP